MSRYETLENSLVALFNVPLTNQEVFDCMALPENEAQYNPQQPRPIVYFSYDSSDYTETEVLSRIKQEEKVLIGCEIHSKTRRGAKGVFAIFDAVKEKLLGYNPAGFEKLTLIKSSALPGAGANHWVFYAQYTTTCHIVDIKPEPDATVNTLKSFEFILEV